MFFKLDSLCGFFLEGSNYGESIPHIWFLLCCIIGIIAWVVCPDIIEGHIVLCKWVVQELQVVLKANSCYGRGSESEDRCSVKVYAANKVDRGICC